MFYTQSYFHQRDLLDLHLAKTIEFLLERNTSGRVVDMGCGTGKLVRYLADSGFNAYGCEPSLPALRMARAINKPHTIIHAKAERLPFRNNSCTMITGISVIEHLTPTQVSKFLKEAHRLLKKNGILFLVTPNYATIWRSIQGKNWFGYSDPTHINFFTPHSLGQLLQTYGFHSHRFQFRTQYNPPYNWELPGPLSRLPRGLKILLTYLLISTPLWRLRNSFWIAVQK